MSPDHDAVTTWLPDPSHYPEQMTPLSATTWFEAMGRGLHEAARELRTPFGGFRTRLELEGSFATVDGGLVLDTIKLAEDSDAIVLRLYEPYGRRGVARVRLAVPVAGARRTNLLEDDGDALEVSDGEIVVPFRPREVVTVKVS